MLDKVITLCVWTITLGSKLMLVIGVAMNIAAATLLMFVNPLGGLIQLVFGMFILVYVYNSWKNFLRGFLQE